MKAVWQYSAAFLCIVIWFTMFYFFGMYIIFFAIGAAATIIAAYFTHLVKISLFGSNDTYYL